MCKNPNTFIFLQTVHPDSATMKTFPSTSKALGMSIPIYKIIILGLMSSQDLCDSIVFGMVRYLKFPYVCVRGINFASFSKVFFDWILKLNRQCCIFCFSIFCHNYIYTRWQYSCHIGASVNLLSLEWSVFLPMHRIVGLMPSQDLCKSFFEMVTSMYMYYGLPYKILVLVISGYL